MLEHISPPSRCFVRSTTLMRRARTRVSTVSLLFHVKHELTLLQSATEPEKSLPSSEMWIGSGRSDERRSPIAQSTVDKVVEAE